MKSLDVANMFIADWGGRYEMTNLKLNKLVYFAQALALRRRGEPLFDDEIQAWAYGPVEPMVYYAFMEHGNGVIRQPKGETNRNVPLESVIDDVMGTYGRLTAFDLVNLSHSDGGAWKRAYEPMANNVITPKMILESSDGIDPENVMAGTLAENVERVKRTWPNALRMLEDS